MAKKMKPGELYLVRFKVPGPAMYHEKLVLWPLDGHCRILMPDGDRYVKPALAAHPDLSAIRRNPCQCASGKGLTEANAYRFRKLPSDKKVDGHV